MRRLLYLTVLWLVASLPALGKTVTVAGTFQTSFGDKEIVEMILEQDGDKVTGKYAFNNGKIEGNLEGRKLTGRWTEDGASGRFEFEFSRDGRSFEGLRTTGDVQPTSESDSWDGVMTTAGSKNKGWVLVGKETKISHESFTTNGHIYDDYNDNKAVIIPVHFTLEGTAEDIKIHAWGNEKEYYRRGEEWSATVTGGFQPLTGPYQAGETVQVSQFHHDEGSIGQSAFSIFWSIWTYIQDSTTGINGGEKGGMFFGDYFADETKEYTFPSRAKVGSDRFDVGFSWRISMAGEYVTTIYHFVWNGRADGSLTGGSSEPAGWFKNIFGEDEHTNALWTIFISGGAGALAVGAIAGMLSGMAPAGGAPAPVGPEGAGGAGDVPGPSDAMETPPVEPVEDDRKKRFFRDDDPDYVRRNIRENGDGSMTLTDPGGGPTQTLYPKYDEAGNRIGWFNQNFTEYDDEGLREWTRWRSENAEEFRKDTAQAERNVAEQRAMNEARDKADRERGSTQTADEVKQWEQHEAHMNKLADQFGIDREDEDALKKAIKRDMKQASIEGAEAEGRAAWWDERIAEAELTEKVCDTIIDTVGEATPQTKAIKTQYHFFKTLGQRSMEGIADNKGLGHTLLKTGQGLAESTIDLYSGDDRWKNHSTLDKLTGGEKGRSVGSSVLKSVMGDLIDGDKDASEIIDNAVKSGVTQYGSDLMGDVIGDQVKDAELTGGATDAHREMVKNLGGEWLNEKITNPVSEEISGELNFWRKKFLGV